MNTARSLRDRQGRYQRPTLERSRPDRHFSGYYRSAEDGAGHGGEAPRTAEQAVVQAVRIAYQVAEEQIARGARLASRLKSAGDAEVGPDSERVALDSVERLVLKGLMAALGWAEAAMAEPGSPLWRAAAVQYRALGSLLGLGEAASAPAPAAPKPQPRSAAASGAAAPLRIVFASDVRLALLDLRERLPASLPPGRYGKCNFHSAQARAAPPFEADLVVDAAGARTLYLTLRNGLSGGWWAAAVSSADGVFLGTLELRL